MSLLVQPASPQDADAAFALRKAASEESPFDRIFFPQTPEDEDVRAMTRALASDIEKSGLPAAQCRIFKVVDTDTLLDNGAYEMIAFGKWTVKSRERTKNEVGDSDPDRFGPGSNLTACALAFDGMEEKKEAHVGDSAHIHLQGIHTHPDHQRRGSGLLLAQRCIQDAKLMGLPIWLESSEEGHRLYQKCGFEDVEELVTDLSQWGAPAPHRSWLMVRPARPDSPAPVNTAQ